MSQTLLSQSNTPNHTPSNQHKRNIPDVCAIHWVSLIATFILTLAATVGPLIAFCITKQAFSLMFISTATLPGYIFYRIVKALFPLSDKDYEIAKIKARQAAGKLQSKKQAI